MRRGSKFLIALTALIFSGLCISVASPAKACDIEELTEESTEVTVPEDLNPGIEPESNLPQPTLKI